MMFPTATSAALIVFVLTSSPSALRNKCVKSSNVRTRRSGCVLDDLIKLLQMQCIILNAFLLLVLFQEFTRSRSRVGCTNFSADAADYSEKEVSNSIEDGHQATTTLAHRVGMLCNLTGL